MMGKLKSKVDMAQMNAAIDKVLALPACAQAEVKRRRAQRKARNPLPAKASKPTAQPVVR